MKEDRLEGAADDIKMPEYLKKRILTKCSEISEDQTADTDKHYHIQASGVERVNSHPIRRTFTAIAACAVLVSGVGLAAHYMPRSTNNDHTNEMSNDDKENITDTFAELLDNESLTENGIELTIEQRNQIKEIISEYLWTELDEERFVTETENAPSEGNISLIADSGDCIYTLVIMDSEYAVFTRKPSEVTEEAQVTASYYSIDTTDMYEKIAAVLIHEPKDINVPVPLSDIAEREYKEVSYSSSEALPKEKRDELAKLFSEDTFKYDPDVSEIYSNPWYIFTDSDCELETVSDYIYLYSSGTAELHENGETYFYKYDFDTISKKIDDILFADRMVKGSDLVCANMLAENVSAHHTKAFEALTLSSESKTAIYDYLSETVFRKCSDDDIHTYRITPASKYYNRALGFDTFELNNYDTMNGWALHFQDDGILEMADVTDGNAVFTYYMYDPVEFYSVVTDAIPELSSGYPPFGLIYKIGNISVNGNEIPEDIYKSLSNVFFGLNWQNETISDDFRSETPSFTIEVGNDLIIRTYDDGTLEYKDADGKVHIYLGIGLPDSMAESIFNILTFWSDPEYY